jgi:hypothetical protein
MDKKQAIKIGAAVLMLVAAGLILFITMREPAETPAAPQASGAEAPAPAGKAGVNEKASAVEGGGGEGPTRGPTRIAPTSK